MRPDDLGIGKFLVLDPLSERGRACLECPRVIPRVELRGGKMAVVDLLKTE